MNGRQEKILKFIEDYTAKHRCPPTVREIQMKMKIKSTSTVYFDLVGLEEEGLVERTGPKFVPLYSKRLLEKINAAAKGCMQNE